MLREDLIAGLDAAGCRHDINDRLTFGDERLHLGAIHKHTAS
ncbi:hypothetical protein AB0N09_07975 [Streptomyces erythrochromogenes]